MDTFISRIERFDSDLWGHHLRVPQEYAVPFKKKKVTRVLCTLDNRITFQCALMPYGDGTHFININKEIRDKLGLKPGSEVVVSLAEDTSKYGLPMPVEFEELLRQDMEGEQLFHKLSPGKQRNLIYIAGKPKLSRTRLRKAIVILEYLKSTHGKLDFKELYTALKEDTGI